MVFSVRKTKLDDDQGTWKMWEFSLQGYLPFFDTWFLLFWKWIWNLSCLPFASYNFFSPPLPLESEWFWWMHFLHRQMNNKYWCFIFSSWWSLDFWDNAWIFSFLWALITLFHSNWLILIHSILFLYLFLILIFFSCYKSNACTTVQCWYLW